MKYDVIIIGGGLGGLACGTILSKEGLNICVLEKHSVIGGCLQSFKRGKYILDTGVHYIGSLSEGQVTNQYLKYFGVLDALRLKKLDEDGFDIIHFGEGKEYRYAMGHEQFIHTLATDFPHEYNGLKQYCKILQDIGNLISPQVLQQGKISGDGMKYMSMSANDTIAQHIKDPILRNVLVGTNGQYAGNKLMTSLYEHGIINHSNIESCYRFIGGSQQLADAFVRNIQENGGVVMTSAEVSKIHLEGNQAQWVELTNGERLEGAHVISSLHPTLTFSLLENNTVIKKAFFSRINSLENSYGIFTTYLLMKPSSLPYENHNYWLYKTNDVWSPDNTHKGYPLPYAFVCMQPNEENDYVNVITILTPMEKHLFERWSHTVTGRRGQEYKDFKKQYSEIVCDFVCRYLPQIRPNIHEIHTSSPLTYRDYTGTPDGSAYGIMKDYHNPMVNHLPVKTKIANLYITGQNLNIHGCLGTSISAVVTCKEFVGTEYLSKKISNA